MLTLKYDRTKEIFVQLIREDNVLKKLQQLKEYDLGTYAHCLRVGLYTIDLGVEDQFEDKEIEELGYSGLFHDLGKIDLPGEMTSLKSQLQEKEREKLKTHVRNGLLRLKDIPYKNVIRIMASHHEFKKNPYPRSGLDRRLATRDSERRALEPKIKELAQILAVCDIYDSLASKRSYKQKFSDSKIREILSSEFRGDRKYIEKIFSRMV